MDLFLQSGMPWKIFNFVVFVVLLFFLLRKGVIQFWRGRHLTIKMELAEAKELLSKAEERSRHLKERVSRIEEEVNEMIGRFKQEGDLEKEKILEQAERQINRLKEESEKVIVQEFRRAEESIKKEMIEVSLRTAEATIRERLAPEDQKRLGAETLRSLGGLLS